MNSLNHKRLNRIFFWLSLASVLLIAIFGWWFVNTWERVKTEQVAGQKQEYRLYPDKRLTPGDINRNITAKEICEQGTKRLRHVSPAKKCEVYKRYGLSCEQKKGAYEIDHFIPLSLGGSNEIENLFPQPAPEYKMKDKVEFSLYRQMCAGEISLKNARLIIWSDWKKWYDETVRLGGIEAVELFFDDGIDLEEGLP